MLVLPRFVSPAQCDAWQGEFWETIGASPEQPESWPGDYTNPGAVPVDWGMPFVQRGESLSDYAPLQGILDQLMGEGKHRRGLRPPNQKFGETDARKETDCMTVNWPEEDGATWEPPAGGHVEGGNGTKDGWKGGFMMGAITYLADVEEKGGAFFYWPRSHRAAHEYFMQHPECINPNEHGHPGWNVETLSAMAGGYPEQPREWLGQKGDTILWHHWTVHQGSSNVLDFPRIGLFARWYHADTEEMRYDIGGIQSDGDLWKYWAPAVREQPPAPAQTMDEVMSAARL